MIIIEKKSNLITEGIINILIGTIFHSFTGKQYWNLLTLLGIGITSWEISKWFKKKDEFYKLFNELKLYTETERPFIITKWQYEWGNKYLLNLPLGMSVNDFEKNKDKIEQYLGAEVNFKFAEEKKITMEIIKTQLNSKYEFEIKKFENIMEIPIGYSKKGFESCCFTEKNPNLLVIGMTGQGKSVFFRQVICTIILSRTPQEILLDLIDLKTGITFKMFKNCIHVDGYADDLSGAISIVTKLEYIMKKREKIFSNLNIDDIQQYNKINKNKPLEYRLVIVDEFATLLDEKSNISSIFTKLIRQGRSAGIFFIFGIQKATTDYLPRSIRSNIGNKLCFKVHDEYDSRNALGEKYGHLAVGLEYKGRAIYQDDENKEVQVMYLSAEKAKKLIQNSYRKTINIDKNNLSGVTPIDN